MSKENGKKDRQEEKDMLTVQERLDEINKKLDLKSDDVWSKAEANLKKLEEDYKKRKGGQEKD